MGPSLTNHGAGHLTGRSQGTVDLDPDVAMDAYLELYHSFGGWDMFEYPVPCMPIRWGYRAGLTARIPGRDLPEDFLPQPQEQENVKFEDYDTIIENGWYRFTDEDLIYRVSGLKF